MPFKPVARLVRISTQSDQRKSRLSDDFTSFGWKASRTSSFLGFYGATVAIAQATKVSQRASEINDETGHERLHAFYETLVHESYHITLWEDWWGIGGSPNMPAGTDTDGDNYPNSFEH